MSSTTTISSQYAAVCFDLDNTLVDWGQNFFMLGKLLRHDATGMLQLHKAMEMARGQRRIDLQETLWNTIHGSVKAGSMDELDEKWSRCYRPKQLMRPLINLIASLDKSGIPRAIVSDYPSISKLQRLGIADGWSTVVSCRDMGALKPLPDGLQSAFTQLGVSPAETLFIGDRWETDGLAAMSAGCGFMHVSVLVGD
jgi:HAD superfamily hydrolase (TIGR01549 family)